MNSFGRKELTPLVAEAPLFYNTMLGVEPTSPLPNGYYYADPDSVGAHEVAELLGDAKLLGGRSPADLHKNAEDWYRWHSVAAVGINVREERTNQLVGTGVLQVAEWEGYLSDFVVSRKHRRNGIGKAIIDERMKQAERLAMEEVRVKVDRTNTLRSYYLENGFQALSRNVLTHRYGARPWLLTNGKRSPLYRHLG